MFLDVPEPWLALPHITRILKQGHSICCYSTCIEQVMKTCEMLQSLQYFDMRMIDVRQRPFDGRIVPLETLDLGFNGDYLLENENTSSIRDPENSYQRWFERDSVVNDSTTRDTVTDSNSTSIIGKRKRTDNNELLQQQQQQQDNDNDHDDNEEQDQLPNPKLPAKLPPKSAVNGEYTMHLARALPSMKGHTAFLTFARRYIEPTSKQRNKTINQTTTSDPPMSHTEDS